MLKISVVGRHKLPESHRAAQTGTTFNRNGKSVLQCPTIWANSLRYPGLPVCEMHPDDYRYRSGGCRIGHHRLKVIDCVMAELEKLGMCIRDFIPTFLSLRVRVSFSYFCWITSTSKIDSGMHTDMDC